MWVILEKMLKRWIILVFKIKGNNSGKIIQAENPDNLPGQYGSIISGLVEHSLIYVHLCLCGHLSICQSVHPCHPSSNLSIHSSFFVCNGGFYIAPTLHKSYSLDTFESVYKMENTCCIKTCWYRGELMGWIWTTGTFWLPFMICITLPCPYSMWQA